MGYDEIIVGEMAVGVEAESRRCEIMVSLSILEWKGRWWMTEVLGEDRSKEQLVSKWQGPPDERMNLRVNKRGRWRGNHSASQGSCRSQSCQLEAPIIGGPCAA